MSEISGIVNPPKMPPKSIDDIFSLVNEITAATDVSKVKGALREILKAIKEDRAYYGRRIDDLSKVQVKSYPFPLDVKSSMDELLDFRNAASHNTRVPLGPYEADRTLYCLVGILTWWQNKIETMDWTKSKEDVLIELINLAKS